MRDRHTHWLRPLKRMSVPSLHLILDTEAEIVQQGKSFKHHFAIAALRCIVRTPHGGWESHDLGTHNGHSELWKAILATTEHEPKVVVWAHNMPYDLRTSNALRHLIDDGWTCDAISLARVSSWGSWTKDKHTLITCDSYSWFHVTLDRLATELGYPRAPFAYKDATTAELSVRAQEDCKILATAVQHTLEWLDAEKLGPFRPTGSGQSHAALRHRFLKEKEILIHCDQAALAAERTAMHTGRTEAWRWGKVKETLHEFDLSLAYCRIAAHHPLPGRLLGEVTLAPSAYYDLRTPERTYLCEVDVTTERPLVPLQQDGRVLWPVGTFRTVLWEPELELLLTEGARVIPRRTWAYETTIALQPMANWIIDELAKGKSPQEAARYRVLKHWARTLVGRMALRYKQWEYFGDSPWDALELSVELPYGDMEAYQRLQLGHTAFELTSEREANSSCPQIPGWVQSQCRVQLWRLIQAAGEESVYYMDTDGLLVNDRGARKLGAFVSESPEPVLVCKGAHRNLAIHGPRQLEFADHRKISGLPAGAIRISEVTWAGETWEGLEAALQAGHNDHVLVMPATWKITPVDHRRQHLPDGTTKPHEIGVDSD